MVLSPLSGRDLAWVAFDEKFSPVFLTAAAAFFLFSTVGRMVSALQPDATWTQWQRLIVIYRFDGLMIGVAAAWISLRSGPIIGERDGLSWRSSVARAAPGSLRFALEMGRRKSRL